MKKIIICLTILLNAVTLEGCHKYQSTYNVVHHPFPESTKNLSSDEIGQAIKVAVHSRNWVCEQEDVNKIKCTCNQRAHQATVEITYSPANFSINYIDSQNLHSNGQLIHRNYNKWIKKIESDIVKATLAMSQAKK